VFSLGLLVKKRQIAASGVDEREQLRLTLMALLDARKVPYDEALIRAKSNATVKSMIEYLERAGRKYATQQLDDAHGFMRDLIPYGYWFNDVLNFANSRIRYEDAVPVMVDWLPYLAGSMQRNVVMALDKPWANAAFDPLLDLFEAGPQHQYDLRMWPGGQIGLVLGRLWNDKSYDRLVSLAQNPKYGVSRGGICYGMFKSKRPEIVDVLLGLVDDETVRTDVLYALARIGTERARPCFELYVKSKNEYWRAEARRGLARLDKLAMKSESAESGGDDDARPGTLEPCS